MIKKPLFFLFLLLSSSVFSQQTNFDKYQYIIVSDKFDFVTETDQYQTSSLTKFLLQKKGFKVFLSSEDFPENLQNNRCLVLIATVIEEFSMVTIKNSIVIKDCYGKTVYTSQVGKSKEKDYKKGYQEAIRDAYESMTDFNYSYNPSLVDVKIEILQDKNIVFPTVDVLHAQTKNNGFQLVNIKLKVLFFIINTNVKDVFIIKDKNGILYKVGDNWVAEFYDNNELITKEYQIKF